MAARSGDSLGIVLLAAGESQRMVAASETKAALGTKTPKALLPWLGRPLIQYQLEQIAAVSPAHVVVVTGFHAERLAPQLAPFTDVRVVENPNPARGRSSSIVHGLQALPEALSAIAIVNVDQPCATAALELLIRARTAKSKRIAIPRYQGKRGHPPLFANALRGELLQVREETQGLKAVTRAHRAETAYVDVDDPSVVWNLNTPADYRQAQQQHVLLATTNSAKADHLAWLLEGVPLRRVTLEEANLHTVDPPTEADLTLKAIAEGKAIAWSRAFGGLALASDGGIAIPALGESWEERLTARFAGSNATDAQRVEALLALLQPYHDEDRSAFFRECVALANNGTLLQSWCAESAPGSIAESYRPDDVVPGFWLLTVWRHPSSGIRVAARSPSEPGYPDGTWARIKPGVQQFLRSHVESHLTSAT